jgi:predicted DNA-binding protein with PD1-like motif
MFTPLLSLAVILAVSGCSSQFEQGYAARQANKQSAPATSESAPAVHTVAGNFSRIIIVRLKPGTDLLDGLQKAVKQENIKNAVILSGVGSLTSYRVHVVDSTTFPVKEAFPTAEGPQDLLNANGYVIDGRVHAHVIFSDQTAQTSTPSRSLLWASSLTVQTWRDLTIGGCKNIWLVIIQGRSPTGDIGDLRGN